MGRAQARESPPPPPCPLGASAATRLASCSAQLAHGRRRAAIAEAALARSEDTLGKVCGASLSSPVKIRARVERLQRLVDALGREAARLEQAVQKGQAEAASEDRSRRWLADARGEQAARDRESSGRGASSGAKVASPGPEAKKARKEGGEAKAQARASAAQAALAAGLGTPVRGARMLSAALGGGAREASERPRAAAARRALSTAAPQGGQGASPLALCPAPRERTGSGSARSPVLLASPGASAAAQDSPISLASSDEEEQAGARSRALPASPEPRRPGRRRAAERSKSEELAGLRCTYFPSRGRGALQLTHEDLKWLEPGEFLNDSVIDYWMLKLRDELSPSAAKRSYFFSSFLYKKLVESGKAAKQAARDARGAAPSAASARAAILAECMEASMRGLRSWTRHVDIFAYDYLFVPVNDALHWSLLVVCHAGLVQTTDAPEAKAVSVGSGAAAPPSPRHRPTPCILHLDSMADGHRSAHAAGLIRAFLAQAWTASKEDSGSVAGRWMAAHPGRGPRAWTPLTVPHRRVRAVRQDNLCDCGLFVCAFADYFARCPPPFVNETEAYEAARAHAATNADLFEGQPDCYPGFLTEAWFPRKNAGSLRRRLRADVLQMAAQQMELLPPGDEAGREQPQETAASSPPPPRVALARRVWRELHEIEALPSAQRYVGPLEWLPRAWELKKERAEALEASRARRAEGRRSSASRAERSESRAAPLRLHATRLRERASASDSTDGAGAEHRAVDLVETPETVQSDAAESVECEAAGEVAESELAGDTAETVEGSRGGEAAESGSTGKALFRVPLAGGSTSAARGAESADRRLWDGLLEKPRQDSRGGSDAFDLLLSPHKRELPKQLLGDLQAALQPSCESFDRILDS